MGFTFCYKFVDELKKAVVSMMVRKDEVEDQNRWANCLMIFFQLKL